MKDQRTQRDGYRMIRSLIIASVLAAVCFYTAKAQTAYKLSASPENVIKVLGSSNVHDWEMKSSTLVCEADFVTAGGEVRSLKTLSFTVNAKTLKSEHSSMDDRTYKTIKANDFPQISFKLSSATISQGEKSRFTIKATGTLTIAGVSKVVTLQVNGDTKADQSILCTGEEKIKLTDFKITPPSFMLGAMKVKDDLTIQYTLNFKNSNKIVSQIN
ncbi:MAG: YceI family protein [Mucilaginibacter sp.]|uniref:YceI family protein n=1 Tax=Mucilaginibacter sp. TaxID=1882438 RepID=UPI0032660C51